MFLPTHGILIYLPLKRINKWLAYVLTFTAIFPDLEFIYRIFNPGDWSAYKALHSCDIFFLHNIIDSFWHDASGQWYWWGIPAEVLIWLIIIYKTKILNLRR